MGDVQLKLLEVQLCLGLLTLRVKYGWLRTRRINQRLFSGSDEHAAHQHEGQSTVHRVSVAVLVAAVNAGVVSPVNVAGGLARGEFGIELCTSLPTPLCPEIVMVEI